MTVSKILIVPDAHIPFEDEKAYGLMLKAARVIKPETVVILGDFADFMSVSSFDKSPDQAIQFEYELEKANARLDELDALGAKHKYYLCGNHEDRLPRLLKRQALALYSTLTVAKVLRLKERGWHYSHYGDHITIGKVSYTHDTGNLGPYAHIRSGQVFESSVVHGHTHYAGVGYFGNARGDTHVAIQSGWLGGKKAAEYLSQIKQSRNWQHGFTFGYKELGGETHLQFIPIIKGVCWVDGKRISA